MNRVKFVPLYPRTRALSEPEVLVIVVTQSKACFLRKPMFKMMKKIRPPCLREAETAANRQGWIRLANLKPSERARYRGAKERVA